MTTPTLPTPTTPEAREPRAHAQAIEAASVHLQAGLTSHRTVERDGDTYHHNRFSDGTQEVWREWDDPSGQLRLVAYKTRGAAWRYFWADDAPAQAPTARTPCQLHGCQRLLDTHLTPADLDRIAGLDAWPRAARLARLRVYRDYDAIIADAWAVCRAAGGAR